MQDELKNGGVKADGQKAEIRRQKSEAFTPQVLYSTAQGKRSATLGTRIPTWHLRGKRYTREQFLSNAFCLVQVRSVTAKVKTAARSFRLRPGGSGCNDPQKKDVLHRSASVP
jgi:hypothetical protein